MVPPPAAFRIRVQFYAKIFLRFCGLVRLIHSDPQRRAGNDAGEVVLGWAMGVALGAKLTLLEGGMQLNAAIFRIKFDDLQLD